MTNNDLYFDLPASFRDLLLQNVCEDLIHKMSASPIAISVLIGRLDSITDRRASRRNERIPRSLQNTQWVGHQNAVLVIFIATQRHDEVHEILLKPMIAGIGCYVHVCHSNEMRVSIDTLVKQWSGDQSCRRFTHRVQQNRRWYQLIHASA